MKLLFDQNISFRILKKLSEDYADARQVRELGLENVSDQEIWQYAKDHNFTIVTFDSDFFDLTNLHGAPPKVIWLRTGNTSTDQVAELLLNKTAIINEFVESSDLEHFACLEID